MQESLTLNVSKIFAYYLKGPYSENYTVYAEQAECKANPAAQQFNCAQRAHQNTLEFAPIFTFGTLITGLKYPCVAAALGSGFVLGRIIYTLGYKTGNPGRVRSGAPFLFLIVLNPRHLTSVSLASMLASLQRPPTPLSILSRHNETNAGN
ncbi:hypothetical protein ID866_5386 [Astraeus odoratus]|nr:hypothetical protein ID866_5386 [Astraeus odoratus]